MLNIYEKFFTENQLMDVRKIIFEIAYFTPECLRQLFTLELRVVGETKC